MNQYLILFFFFVSIVPITQAQPPIQLDDFIEIKPASGTLPAIVQQNVNVREAPNKNGKKLGLLSGGETISAEFFLESEWAKIQFENKEAFVHTSALIKLLYSADISHSTENDFSSVFSMSGWHYSFLPGSYFITFQNNKFGSASYGPLNGSGYTSIESKLYKLKYSKRDIYFTTTHSSGNRTYYSPYLAIPDIKELIIIPLPSITEAQGNKISLSGDTLSIYGKSFDSCCSFESYELKIDLTQLNYVATQSSYNKDGSQGSTAPKSINLEIKRIQLIHNK